MENVEELSGEKVDKEENNTDLTSESVPMLDVKSTAVVKYAKMGPMETYSTLELNTDIKQPPDNWLRDNLHGRFSSWTSSKHEPIELSSLNMAHTFPESVDEVDVISDAENIKKLLKMPFSKTGISMTVNKVGRTLLLDEFDVQNLLSHAAQKENLESLTWLQDVFSEEANMEKDQTALRKKKNPSESRERSMMSKFLCYSSREDSIASRTVDQESPSTFPDHSEKISDGSSRSSIHAKELTSSCKALVPFLPEPVLKPQEKLPFQRNVLWKFEDTKMLIGSNMPIFGGGKYPAVSLRLKDCSKPINVLTGLDYWLDNLMCNVPEVVMCFHLDGIVQKYEHYKTDELPHIEGSQFSPKVIKDVARNILSFLKSNCTLEGHTYWLFKGNGSDVVKLYDLTSLCDKTADGESTNPFSVPVAMLLYRVAKNMINQSKITRRERDMIQVLLTNCLHLLNDEPHPDDHLEIITSANYLLAEVYSMGNKNDDDELLENGSHNNDADPSGDEDEGFPWPKTLTISDLSKSNSFEETYEEVSLDLPSNVNEELRLSVSHVVKALKNLREAWGDRKFSNPNNESKRNHLLPSRPYLLALPNAVFGEKSGDELSSFAVEGTTRDQVSPLNFNFRQWQGTFESVLIRKAAVLYSDLSSLTQAHGAFGTALRYSRLSLGCLSSYRNMEWVNASQELDLLPTVLCGCGDIYLSMARSRDLEKCLEQCEKDYVQLAEDDRYFDGSFGTAGDPVYHFEVEFTPDVEKLLKKSLGFYEAALDVFTDEQQVDQLVKLTKRLGNVRNELGLFYMNTAVKGSTGTNQFMDDVRELWEKSLDSFTGGIRAFQAVNDRANVALLYSNTGRLMRVCTQTLFGDCNDHATFDPQEKVYYTKAIEYYQQSLRVLRERHLYPEIWDRVSWELSGTFYTMGTLVQDFTLSRNVEPEQCEREVSDLMFKALKICEGLKCSYDHAVKDVKNRIGMIHYRLGSLYHHSYRTLPTSDQNFRKKRHLADLHYNKAIDHLDIAVFPCEWLRTNLERVALLEHQLNCTRVKAAGAIKILETILELLLNSQKAFEVLGTKGKKFATGGESSNIPDRTKLTFEDKPEGATYGEETCMRELAASHGTSLSDISLTNLGEIDSPEREMNNSINFVSFDGHSEMADGTKDDEKSKEFSSLAEIFESRLKSTLKELVKLSSSMKGPSATQKRNGNVLKLMFEVTLRAGVSTPEDIDRREKILNTILTLKQLQNSME